MKPIFYLAIILLCSCKRKQPNVKIIATTDTLSTVTNTAIELPKNKLERVKYHTDKDSVYISSTAKDTLKFSKDEFNDIVDNFPELTSKNLLPPDSAYYAKIWVDVVDSKGDKQHISFGSEAGRDNYYIVYAYFLKQKNGIAKYALRRKKLLEMYRTLNSIFGNLNHGGTYFGHKYRRIEGYAEFSVYWFKHYEDYFDRSYDISKQKAYYIGGLKQLIVDEVRNDESIGLKEKAEEQENLCKKVDELNRLITDNFYLRMAKSFQSEHY
jgi:hypothetical protein